MSFSSTVVDKTVFGNKRRHTGTFSCASVAGGNIDTGLARCEHIALTLKGAAVGANCPAVNETMPCAGNAVTIVTDSSAQGYWEATGY